MGKEQILERKLPYPVLLPAPSLLHWAQFEIFKEGCPFCGERTIYVQRRQTGPVQFSEAMGNSSGESEFPRLSWEDFHCRCEECEKSFILRYLSPASPSGNYRKILVDHLRDMIDLFAGEMAENELIPNYVAFRPWFEGLVKTLFIESQVKGPELMEAFLDGMKDLQREIGHTREPTLFDFKRAKLFTFAVFEASPEPLKEAILKKLGVETEEA